MLHYKTCSQQWAHTWLWKSCFVDSPNNKPTWILKSWFMDSLLTLIYLEVRRVCMTWDSSTTFTQHTLAFSDLIHFDNQMGCKYWLNRQYTWTNRQYTWTTKCLHLMPWHRKYLKAVTTIILSRYCEIIYISKQKSHFKVYEVIFDSGMVTWIFFPSCWLKSAIMVCWNFK